MNPQHSSPVGLFERTLRRSGRVCALRTGVAVVLVAAVVGLAGCTPGPAPKPAPTPLFTSEAEAFKAAEQVYRDYTAAGNARNAGDSSAQPEKYLAGTALDEELAVRRALDERNLRISGAVVIITFDGTSFDSKTSRVHAKVCLDASKARVIDDAGLDVTPQDRKSIGALDIGFDRSHDQLLVTKSASSDAECPSSAG